MQLYNKYMLRLITLNDANKSYNRARVSRGVRPLTQTELNRFGLELSNRILRGDKFENKAIETVFKGQ